MFPSPVYGLEACQNKSINYVTDNTFSKIFNTRSQETVDVQLGGN